MKYSTTLEHDESSFRMLTEQAENFGLANFLAAIQDKRFDRYDIERLAIRVSRCTSVLYDEYVAMRKFGEDFNSSYATSDNQYFSTATEICRQIRHSLVSVKNIYLSFTKTKRDKYRLSYTGPGKAPCIYMYSPLSSLTIQTDMLGIESYDESVNTLYVSMGAFFSQLVKIMRYCRTIINDERLIKNSPDRCNRIYHKCFDEVASHIRSFLNLTDFRVSMTQIAPSALDLSKQSTLSEEQFAQANYHVFNKQQFESHVASELLRKGLQGDYTPEEMLLWPSDQSRIARMRYLISHCDQIDEAEGRSGSINAKLVACLYLWSGATDQSNWLKYFQDVYLSNGGRYRVISAPALCTAIQKVQDDPQFRASITRQINHLLHFFS